MSRDDIETPGTGFTGKQAIDNLCTVKIIGRCRYISRGEPRKNNPERLKQALHPVGRLDY